MLSVRPAVCDDKAVASLSLVVVSGLSWGRLASSLSIQDVSSQDTARPGIWSLFVKSSQLVPVLLLVSVVVTTVEMSGSVD